MLEYRLDSVVFSTNQLSTVRDFYLNKLGLAIGTYEKDGKAIPDENDKYVNFHCGETLICFEVGEKTERGTLVLLVENLSSVISELEKKKVTPRKRAQNYAIIVDPEGREIILQQS